MNTRYVRSNPKGTRYLGRNKQIAITPISLRPRDDQADGKRDIRVIGKHTGRKVFICEGPPEKVKKATLRAPRQVRVKVKRSGLDLGAGVVQDRRGRHLSLY